MTPKLPRYSDRLEAIEIAWYNLKTSYAHYEETLLDTEAGADVRAQAYRRWKDCEQKLRLLAMELANVTVQ